MTSKIYQFDPCKPDFLTNLSTVKFNDDQVKLPDKNRGICLQLCEPELRTKWTFQNVENGRSLNSPLDIEK